METDDMCHRMQRDDTLRQTHFDIVYGSERRLQRTGFGHESTAMGPAVRICFGVRDEHRMVGDFRQGYVLEKRTHHPVAVNVGTQPSASAQY